VSRDGQRPALPGERCTCGRPAVLVILGSQFGPTGWCGRSDGGDQTGPCPFCGQPRHDYRCPRYRLVLLGDSNPSTGSGGDSR